MPQYVRRWALFLKLKTMNDVRLCDLTLDQLQVLYAAVELLKHERKQGYFKSHSDDDIDLVKTQVLHAVGIVAMREKITSN